MIFPDLKLLFVQIPKTGGTSVTNFILKNIIEDFPEIEKTTERTQFNSKAMLLSTEYFEHKNQTELHKPLADYLDENKNWHEYFKITILRCPLERFISAYYYLDLQNNYSLNSLCNTIEPWLVDNSPSNLHFAPMLGLFFRPQTTYLEPCVDQIDQFFVTEKLDDAFLFLSKKYGFQYDYLHHNKTKRSSKDVLDGKTIKFIYKHYEKDFDLYNKVKSEIFKND